MSAIDGNEGGIPSTRVHSVHRDSATNHNIKPSEYHAMARLIDPPSSPLWDMSTRVAIPKAAKASKGEMTSAKRFKSICPHAYTKARETAIATNVYSAFHM
jgi:hypothetical protein